MIKVKKAKQILDVKSILDVSKRGKNLNHQVSLLILLNVKYYISWPSCDNIQG